jgi:predicted O-linked N-acetylglucosamine transferase (SPINDLY family)
MMATVTEVITAALRDHQAGKLSNAARLYRAVLAVHPSDVNCLHLLSLVEYQFGHYNEATTLIERALALRPEFAAAHFNLGIMLQQRGMLKEAVTEYERTLVLDPSNAAAHCRIGNALDDLARFDEAMAHYSRAANLKPDYAEAHHNIANALVRLGKLDEAVALYNRALALKLNSAAVHYNLGTAFQGLGRMDEALAQHERALAIKPDYAAARFAKCMVQLPIIYNDEHEILRRRSGYRKSLKTLCEEVNECSRPGDFAEGVGASQPFFLAYQGMNDRELQQIYGSLICRIMSDTSAVASLPEPPRADEPVRVGIVSGFFQSHQNWKIPIKGWVSQLDHRKFQVLGYYTGAKRDTETKTAATFCDRFVQGPMSTERWRETILGDAPHILIYPEVGMDATSAQLAAQRLAPVQCNSWGHPVTSGFPTLDYYLSSDLMEPPNAQDHYTERLIRLPNLSIYYEPIETKPVCLDREQLSLRPTAIVYWCGQNLCKYLPQYDEVFPRIAKQVGNCQFVFIEFSRGRYVTDLFRQRIGQAFHKFGLRAEDYCVFLPTLDVDRFVAAIGQCDIVLDSIGWSGCNSLLESLAHCLPVVTMRGSLMRSRHGAAILGMMGVTETITESLESYIAIAAQLARDEAWRTKLSRKMSVKKHRLYRERACISALEDFLNRVARNLHDS